MKLSTLPLRTKAARSAAQSRWCRCFIARQPRPREAGLGIATASNAGASPAQNMGRQTATIGTLGCAHGDSKIHRPQPRMTNAHALSANTGCLNRRLTLCALRRAVSALYVNDQRPVYSSIIATPKAMSAHYSVKHATHSSAGTNARPTPFSAFSDTSRHTPNPDEPCHADVLLEIANK